MWPFQCIVRSFSNMLYLYVESFITEHSILLIFYILALQAVSIAKHQISKLITKIKLQNALKVFIKFTLFINYYNGTCVLS